MPLPLADEEGTAGPLPLSFFIRAALRELEPLLLCERAVLALAREATLAGSHAAATSSARLSSAEDVVTLTLNAECDPTCEELLVSGESQSGLPAWAI